MLINTRAKGFILKCAKIAQNLKTNREKQHILTPERLKRENE